MPTVRLIITHTHAGVVYPAGHLLEVDDFTARWLIEHGIATLIRRDVPLVIAAPTPRQPRQPRIATIATIARE